MATAQEFVRVSDDDPPEDPAEPTVESLKAELAAKDKALSDQKLAAAEQLRKETQARDEFWAKRQASPPTQKTTPESDDADPLDELDWLNTLVKEEDAGKIRNIINKRISASMDYRLKKGGYVRAEEVDAKINALIDSVTQMQKLTSEFPEMQTDKDFAAEVSKQIGLLEKDPMYANVPDSVLHRAAALQAKLTVGKTEKEDEAGDRYERIARQQGGRGRGTQESTGGLSVAEKEMAAKIGVSEKAYLEQRQRLQLGPAMQASRAAREMSNG